MDLQCQDGNQKESRIKELFELYKDVDEEKLFE